MSGSRHTIRCLHLARFARRLSRVSAAFLLTSLLVANGRQQAQAQLFGARTLGRGANSPSALMTQGRRGGPLSGRGGRAAFQRPSSSADAFVGRDQLERETFIGLAQGSVASAEVDTSSGLRRSRAQDILSRRRLNANVLQIQRGTGAQGPIYAPRLEVQFAYRSSATSLSDRRAEETIALIFATQGLSQVTLTVESGVATLRGKVASQAQKQLAAAVVNLEPAVRTIDNQLQLLSEPLSGAEPLTAPD